MEMGEIPLKITGIGGILGNAATGRIAMKECLLIVILLQHLEWCDCGDDSTDFLNFHEKLKITSNL